MGIRILELAKKAYGLYFQQTRKEKRRLLNFVLSNCTLLGEKLVPEYKNTLIYLSKGVVVRLAAYARAKTEFSKMSLSYNALCQSDFPLWFLNESVEALNDPFNHLSLQSSVPRNCCDELSVLSLDFVMLFPLHDDKATPLCDTQEVFVRAICALNFERFHESGLAKSILSQRQRWEMH